MSTDIDIRPVLRALLESQRFAVLATEDQGQPFASLMAFAATDDLRHMVILTERTTRKYANLKSNPGSPCWSTTARTRAPIQRTPW
jgi:nitroimidazol reductase NimA-like FMN-containing flavoprotein (pyridoxamine 5'-phosphate oxidase superfamily)